jgi:hypothetical protein
LAGTDWKFSISGSRNPKRKAFFFAEENNLHAKPQSREKAKSLRLCASYS